MSIKLIEALTKVRDVLETWCDHLPPIIQDEAKEALALADEALVEPIRNCNLYDSEEDAWNAYLQLHPNAECPNDEYEMWLFDPAEMKGETK